MERELTSEEKAAMGIGEFEPSPVSDIVGWSKDRIKRELLLKGFSISGFERQAGIPKGSVNQSLIARRPKTDKMIAAFLGVHESEIWPDRYFVSGASISKQRGKPRPSTENTRKINENIEFHRRVKRTIKHIDGSVEYIYRTQLPPGLEVSE